MSGNVRLLLLVVAGALALTVVPVPSSADGTGSTEVPAYVREELWIDVDSSVATSCHASTSETMVAPTMFVVANSTMLNTNCTATACTAKTTGLVYDAKCSTLSAGYAAKSRSYIIVDLFSTQTCQGPHQEVGGDIGRWAIAPSVTSCDPVVRGSDLVTQYYYASCTTENDVELKFCADSLCSADCADLSFQNVCNPSFSSSFPPELTNTTVNLQEMILKSASARYSCFKYYGTTTAVTGTGLNSPLIIGITMVLISSFFVGVFVFHYVRRGSSGDQAGGSTTDNPFVPLQDEESAPVN